MKQRGHVLALIYRSEDDPSFYFNKLKLAEEKLATNQIMAWNDSSLWEETSRAAHFHLFSHFIGANWNREDRNYQAKMSDVLSNSFLNVLMRSSH